MSHKLSEEQRRSVEQGLAEARAGNLVPGPDLDAEVRDDFDFESEVDRDLQLLILSLALSRGGDGQFSEDEIATVARWADEVRINAAMLNLVLDGRVLVDVEGDKVCWRGPTEAEVAERAEMLRGLTEDHL